MSSVVHKLEAKTARWTRRGLIVVTLILLATAFGGAFGTQRLFSSEAKVAQSHRLHIGLERLLSLLRDAETGQRGYLLTGRDEYLAPYVEATAKIAATFDEISPLVEQDPQQQRLLAALRVTAEQKLHELGYVITTRRTNGFNAALTLVQRDTGRLLMDRARQTVAEMDAATEAQLAARRAAARRVRDAAVWVAILSASLTIFMSASFAYWMKRLTDARMGAIDQLHDQKELMRVTLASIGEGVATTDAAGRLSSLNIVGSRLTGWEETAAMGLPIEQVMELADDADCDAGDRPFRAAIRESRTATLTGETILIARDGTKSFVDCSIAPMSDTFSNRMGSVIVFRNVTIRKQHEQELRDSDRRKGEFLAVMSHELRNPVAAIQGALDLLRHTGVQADQQKEMYALMARQVRQIVRIIDDLLDVVRVSKGLLELKMGAVDLLAMFNIAIETAKPTLDKRQNIILTDFRQDLPSIQGDAARLSQAVANLLINASKYSSLGSAIRLTVTVNQDQVTISVCDQGIGLLEEDQDRIFEMFTQVGRTDDLSKDGLGVGLSLCRQIAFLHGGQVSARSAGPGLGSVFTIALPSRGSAALPVVTLPMPHAALDQRSGVRVLVADDNEDAADALATLLRLSGYEVSVAHDGEQATKLAASQQPDIALLDIGMPKLTGYQVAQQIRSQVWNKRPLLIAITGWGQPEDRRNSAEAGFDKHFTKPVDFETLAQAIADASLV